MDSDSDSELDEEFNIASNYVQAQATNSTGKKLDDSKLLQLYGLYKVATVGPCNETQPGIFNLKGRKKWSAWKNISNVSQTEAKNSYIKLVKDFLDWKNEPISDKNQVGKKSKSTSISTGNTVSCFAIKPEDENELGEDQETIFGWAKDNNLVKIKDWLDQGNDPNIQDSEKRSPLHWSVDRGHYEASKLFLLSGAKQGIRDFDDQTPLDYAETCEYEDLVKLLKSFDTSNSKSS